MKKDTWILVSNSSLARIYRIEKNKTLIEIEELEHPESRMHERDLVDSRPGRAYESVGNARHAMEPQTSQKQQEYNTFAKNISTYLETARKEGKFDRLYISASPLFLGLLRPALSTQTNQLIVGEIDKDMTQMEPSEIREKLPIVA